MYASFFIPVLFLKNPVLKLLLLFERWHFFNEEMHNLNSFILFYIPFKKWWCANHLLNWSVTNAAHLAVHPS